MSSRSVAPSQYRSALSAAHHRPTPLAAPRSSASPAVGEICGAVAVTEFGTAPARTTAKRPLATATTSSSNIAGLSATNRSNEMSRRPWSRRNSKPVVASGLVARSEMLSTAPWRPSIWMSRPRFARGLPARCSRTYSSAVFRNHGRARSSSSAMRRSIAATASVIPFRRAFSSMRRRARTFSNRAKTGVPAPPLMRRAAGGQSLAGRRGRSAQRRRTDSCWR